VFSLDADAALTTRSVARVVALFLSSSARSCSRLLVLSDSFQADDGRAPLNHQGGLEERTDEGPLMGPEAVRVGLRLGSARR
jgi:hypothetical protein